MLETAATRDRVALLLIRIPNEPREWETLAPERCTEQAADKPGKEEAGREKKKRDAEQTASRL